MDENKATELFNAWFVEPLELLKQKGPNAGWVALMVALPLYDRWINAKLETENPPAGKTKGDLFFELMRDDLKLNDATQAMIFWERIRDGVLHGGMPRIGQSRARRKLPKIDDIRYIVHPNCSAFPVFGEYDGKPVIYIDPWKFADRVIQLYDDPKLIIASKDFPFASVQPLDENQLRKYCPDQPIDGELPHTSTRNSPPHSPGTAVPW